MVRKMLAVAIFASASMFSISQAAYAQDDKKLDELQATMQMMMQRIEALEKENASLKSKVTDIDEQRVSSVSPSSVSSIEPAADGATKIPGTDTTIKLGGYIKADFIEDIGTGYGEDFAKFAAIPLDNSSAEKKSSDFHAHARQTRLNLTTTTPTEIGEVKAVAEVDFFGTRGSELATNGHEPQLRLAYGQVGGLMAGQNWSNFFDAAAYPETLDYVGPVGVTIIRQVQLRYSGDINDNGLGYSVSLENPNSDFTNGSADTVVGYERYPDFVGVLTQKQDWGHVSLSGILRDISVKNETTDQSESDIAYALSASSNINLGESDNLKFRAAYGNGLGRYIYDIATSAKGAAYNNGTLDLQDGYAGYAAYQHKWTDDLRSTLMGGYASMDNETALIGNAQNKSIWSGHANLIWQPVKQYKVGVEYMHGERELDNGSDGKLDRVQASFIYNLN